MSVKLLTEHHLEFLSLKGGCTGSSESTPVKMSYCWKSHVTTHVLKYYMHQIKLSYFPDSEIQRYSSECTDAQFGLHLCYSHAT